MDKLVVRDMRESDVEQVLAIENECFSSPWSEKAFIKELNENKMAHYLVVALEERVIGYVGMWKIVNEGHITNIAVDPKHRNIGAGGSLLDALIYNCLEYNIDSLTLEVRVSNKTAQNLYQSRGFEVAGIRPNYYENGEDALIMWKNI